MKKLFSIIAVVICLCSCSEDNYIVDRNGIVVGITTEYRCKSLISPKTKYKVDVNVLYNYGREEIRSSYVLYTDHKYAIGDTIKFY
jgi:hypothetical protein